MLPRMSDRPPGWLRGVLLALLAGLILSLSVPAARADDKKGVLADDQPARGDVKKDSALSHVPADSSFFTSYLRGKEQLDLFYKSQAYKTLRKLPLVQTAYKEAMAKMKEEGGPLEAYNKFIEVKENKELVDLLLAALSDEVFLSGGKGFTDLLALWGKVNGGTQFTALEALLTMADPNKAQNHARLQILQKNREQLLVPSLVIGFKVNEPKKVLAQIKRLEKPLAKHLDSNDKLKDKLKVKGDFLTLTIDGTIIPWDDINLSDIEEKKGEFDDLVKHVKKLTLTVSLGVKGNYLLLGISSTLDDIEKLGKGKTLGEREELAVIDKFTSKKITHIAYTSKNFLEAASGYNNIDEMAKGVTRVIDKTPLKPERKKAINKDVRELFSQWKKGAVLPGAQVSFQFLTDTGYEMYAYDFTKHDKLKPVDTKLVNHVGGNPIFAAAFGFNADGSSYAVLRKLLQKSYEHGEAVFLEMVTDDNIKDAYKKNVKIFMPLVKQVDSATTKLLIPSLKESGMGIVIDAKWSSKQWHTNMPKLEKALPMLELGLLIGVSDGKKFAAAIKEYRTTLNELYEKIRNLEGLPNAENLPEFKIPAPDSAKVKNGTLYSWKLPEESGLDKQILPTAGVGKHVSVLAPSKECAERLMASTKLKPSAGPLPVKGKLVGFAVLNWPALIDAALPWVDFTINAATIFPADDAEAAKKAKDQAAEWAKEARQIAAVLKCFKGFASASYLDEGKLVTHTRWVFKDLSEKPAAPRD